MGANQEKGQPNGIKNTLGNKGIEPNDVNKGITNLQIINDQISRHSNQIDPYKKNDKNKHTDDEINSRKDNDIHNNSNLHKYAIELRNAHNNYLRLISGTSLEKDQANEDVFIGTHGHMSESSYEDDGAEPSSEDEKYEDKISSEESDEFESLDSESFHSEDYLDNLDSQTTNNYVAHLIGNFIPQTLVEVNISSEMDRIIHTTYFSPRGKERERGDSESLKMMMKKLEAYGNILGQLINKFKSDFYVSFEDGDPKISNISQITGFKQVVMVGIVVTVMMVVVDSDGGGCDVMLLDMWPSLISKVKEGGIDVIETYVFWNLHELQPGQYDFSGRRDVVAFMKEIQAQGLYACLRMGPYIEAEWTYGTAAEYMITSYYDQAPLDEYAEKWEQFEEVIPQFDDTSLRSDILLEHMNTTKDVSDYLWYTSSIQQDSMEQQSTLSVKSLGHVLHAFVNGEHVGSAHGQFRKTSFTLESTVSLNKGTNNISLISATVGLPVGLLGEKLQLYSSEGSNSADWSSLASSQPLTWYKSVFDAPKGDDPVALNLGSMGKGEAWVNGQSIGRYWVSFQKLAGIPSQTWYNVPRSFLQPGDNLLVFFEEETGSPLDITLDTISVSKPPLRK
ncbi:Beta-galactosidase 16 [Capsicum chinense]|nr:Beta-galactosidase 16 [Capsicum chinense]